MREFNREGYGGRLVRDHKQALYEGKVRDGDVVGYHWLDYDKQAAELAKIYAPEMELAKSIGDLSSLTTLEAQLHRALAILWSRLSRASGSNKKTYANGDRR